MYDEYIKITHYICELMNMFHLNFTLIWYLLKKNKKTQDTYNISYGFTIILIYHYIWIPYLH